MSKAAAGEGKGIVRETERPQELGGGRGGGERERGGE